MYNITSFGDQLPGAFQQAWLVVATFLPNLLAAIIVLVIGWVISSMVGRFVAQIISALKLDNLFRSIGAEEVLNRGGFQLNIGRFIGGVVKWFLILVFLMVAVNILNLQAVSTFLGTVISYLPNVIAAALILVIAAVVAQFIQRLIEGSVKAASLPSAHLLGGIARWAIWIVAILAALGQLGIDIGTQIANTLAVGVVAMFAIAGGLAFGLGGKEAAAHYIEHWRKDISER